MQRKAERLGTCGVHNEIVSLYRLLEKIATIWEFPLHINQVRVDIDQIPHALLFQSFRVHVPGRVMLSVHLLGGSPKI